MKHFIIAAVLAGATVTSASAYTGLSEVKRIEVQRLVPGADTSNLTPAQIGALELFFDNSDNLRSGNNPSGKVQRILNQS